MSLFNSINTNKASITELEEVVRKYISDLTIAVPLIPAGTKFYRTRICNHIITNISELEPPSNHLIKNMGRLNDVGKRVGYYSYSHRSAGFEVQPKSEDMLYMTEWQSTEDMLVIHIGYSKSKFTEWNSVRSTDDFNWVIETKKTNLGDDAKYNCLSNILTENVSSPEDYKKSVAIGNVFLSDGPHDGLMYPTVSMKGNSDNFAIKENSLRKLNLSWIEVFKIKSADRDNITSSTINSAVKWNNSGTITWNNRPLQWDLAPGEKGKAKVVDGRWVMFNSEGRKIPPV